jgi:hypothetical protein
MNQEQIERLCRALVIAIFPQAEQQRSVPSKTIHEDCFIGSYCIVRSARAGVFAGVVTTRNGQEVTMTNARRIWYWDGAASLSQLATDGTSKPENCKFPAAVPNVALFEVIEILPASAKSEASIKGVASWVK